MTVSTHCVKGHYAEWCTCRTFRPAPNGTFTGVPMIRYPDPPDAEQPAAPRPGDTA